MNFWQREVKDSLLGGFCFFHEEGSLKKKGKSLKKYINTNKMHMIQSYMLFLKKKTNQNEEKRGVMLELLSF